MNIATENELNPLHDDYDPVLARIYLRKEQRREEHRARELKEISVILGIIDELVEI